MLPGRTLIAGLVGAVIAGATGHAAAGTVVSTGSVAASPISTSQATIANLTITAVAKATPRNALYPGANGDAVIKITNPNSFPVTVTAVQLPTNTTYANAYTDSALTMAVTGCTSSTPSGVGWNFATAGSGTSHPLTTPLTVAANGNLSVTLTNDVTMASSAPAACAGAYFSLPSLAGVTATGGAASVTTGPATDAWTS
jgi:hypothetical protein